MTLLVTAPANLATEKVASPTPRMIAATTVAGFSVAKASATCLAVAAELPRQRPQLQLTSAPSVGSGPNC